MSNLFVYDSVIGCVTVFKSKKTGESVKYGSVSIRKKDLTAFVGRSCRVSIEVFEPAESVKPVEPVVNPIPVVEPDTKVQNEAVPA